MGSGRVVEQARERSQHVVVVVEDLVVEAARAGMALHEDRVGGVDLDLPHVVVREQRCQRAVAAQVAERAIDHRLGIGDRDGVEPSLEVDVPPIDLVFEDRAEPLGGLFVDVEALGSLLHPPFDLGERRGFEVRARGRSSYRVRCFGVGPVPEASGCDPHRLLGEVDDHITVLEQSADGARHRRHCVRGKRTSAAHGVLHGAPSRHEHRRSEALGRRRRSRPTEHRQRVGDRGPTSRRPGRVVHDGHDSSRVDTVFAEVVQHLREAVQAADRRRSDDHRGSWRGRAPRARPRCAPRPRTSRTRGGRRHRDRRRRRRPDTPRATSRARPRAREVAATPTLVVAGARAAGGSRAPRRRTPSTGSRRPTTTRRGAPRPAPGRPGTTSGA